jgi:hypothetical protein
VPTVLVNAAGIRPDPAVSVPKLKRTKPRETVDADPELEPPLTYIGLKGLVTTPYGERVPTKPVAN